MKKFKRLRLQKQQQQQQNSNNSTKKPRHQKAKAVILRILLRANVKVILMLLNKAHQSSRSWQSDS